MTLPLSDPGWTWPALPDVAPPDPDPEPIPPLYIPPAELPLAQQMVLLILRRRDALAVKVLTAMRTMGVPEPTEDDRKALVISRHVTRAPKVTYLKLTEVERGEGVLQLTPVTGLLAAKKVADLLAVRYGIHHITRQTAFGTLGHSCRCTCGWGTYGTASGSGQSSVGNYAARHLEQAASDTLPPKFKLPRFTAEVVS